MRHASQGLGARNQGMNTALDTLKTGSRTGKIVDMSSSSYGLKGAPSRCVAVCCSVLQCVAVCCSVLQCLAVSCSVLQWQWQHGERVLFWLRSWGCLLPGCCIVLQCAAMCCSVLLCCLVRCSVLQCVAVCCSLLRLHTICLFDPMWLCILTNTHMYK